MLPRSVLARYRQGCSREAPLPEGGYHGEYVRDLAAALQAEYGEKFLDLPEQESLPVIGEFATRLMLEEIKGDLERFGIHFDSWVSEKTLLGRWGPPDQARLLATVRDLFGPPVYEEGGGIRLPTPAC